MAARLTKIDVHTHILPERWPDLKEVSSVSSSLGGLVLSSRISKRSLPNACSVMATVVGYNYTTTARGRRE